MRIERFVVGPLRTNCYLLEEGGEAVVIDPGAITPELMAALKGKRTRYILLTHGHFDHAEGAPSLRERTGAALLYHAAERASFLAFGREPPRPDGYLEEGLRIAVGRESLEVWHLPGHSPGSVVFLWRVGKVIFGGDLLFAGSVGRWDLPGGSLADLRVSLRRIMGLPDDWKVLPGHGPPTTIGSERRGNPLLKELLWGNLS